MPTPVQLLDKNGNPVGVDEVAGQTVTKGGRRSQFIAAGYADTDIVHMDVQNIQAQTAFMLIDLSDIVNWPHTDTGYITIEYIIIEIDPDANFVGEVKLGFLSNVDATNGDFNQVLDVDMVRKADLLVETIDFGTHGMDLEKAHWFGPVTADSTLFQTDVNLLGPDGNTSYPSGNGDLVMIIERTAGAVDVSLSIGYETSKL